jgi:hypothetical protein
MQTVLIKRFVTKAGKKSSIALKLTERCSERKNEKVKEMEINTISQQKIIHRGAKFFRKRFDILFSLVVGIGITFFTNNYLNPET